MIEAKWNPEQVIPAHYSILLSGDFLTQYHPEIKRAFEQHSTLKFDEIKYLDHAHSLEYIVPATKLEITQFDAICEQLTKLAFKR